MRGHPLLPELQLVAAKVGKNAPGGPPAPRLPADFLFMKIGGNTNTSTNVHIKWSCGPGAPGAIAAYRDCRSSVASRRRSSAARSPGDRRRRSRRIWFSSSVSVTSGVSDRPVR